MTNRNFHIQLEGEEILKSEEIRKKTKITHKGIYLLGLKVLEARKEE